jgi:hypothetical protein
MNYPASLRFPDSRAGTLLPISSPSQNTVNATALIDALAIVVRSARANGQTLEDLTLEVLADDVLLEPSQRRILSEVVAQAWEQFPS